MLSPEGHERRASTLREYERIYNAAGHYIRLFFRLESISLDDFCQEHHYSRRNVQRALRHFDTGWREMLTKQRIYEASHALTTTNDTIKSISMTVGYSSQAQFAKAFKRIIGKEPREYRNEQRQPRS